MSDIDKKILEALKAETDATMRGYEHELGLFGLIVESFKGRFRWFVIGGVVMQVVFAVAFIYCAFGLYGTDDAAAKLDWLAPGIAAFIAFGLLRIWYFMEVNRLSIALEIKRLELQVSAVANVVRSSGSTG
jgi:uncharacterized membrane protein